MKILIMFRKISRNNNILNNITFLLDCWINFTSYMINLTIIKIHFHAEFWKILLSY